MVSADQLQQSKAVAAAAAAPASRAPPAPATAAQPAATDAAPTSPASPAAAAAPAAVAVASSSAASAAAAAAAPAASAAAAAAASADVPPPRQAKDGRLYACGKVAGANKVKWVPLADKFIDNMAHCPFPQPLSIGDNNVRFKEVKGEHTLFAALESRPSAGGLWVGGPGLPTMERVIPAGVVSFSVGQSHVLAALNTGALLIVGSHRKLDASTANTLTPRPFKIVPPAAVVSVSCSELNIAIATADGRVFTLGDTSTGNGHNAPVNDNWKEIKLLKEFMYTRGSNKAPGPGAAAADGAAPAAAAADVLQKPSDFRAVMVTQGGVHGAAMTACGKVFGWGDGMSGSLGIGRRVTGTPAGIAYGHDFSANGGAVFVACTTAQSNPKRVLGRGGTCAGGQEGPRCHVITRDGKLFIAGTTHKGLGANCLYKTLGMEEDLLEFYRVGGAAADWKSPTVCPTGGAEDLARKNGNKEVIAMHLGMESADMFGAGHNTNYLTEPGLRLTSTQPVHIHSVAVSEDGRCFSWGCGSDGRTGLEAFLKGPHGSKRIMKNYVSSPSAIEGLDGKHCVHAYACRYYTLFVVAD